MLKKGAPLYDEYQALANEANDQIFGKFRLGVRAKVILQDSSDPEGDLKSIARTSVVSVKDVRSAFDFASWMGDEEAVAALLNRRGTLGVFITWPIIFVLLRNNDTIARSKFLDMFFATGMSSNSLLKKMFPKSKKQYAAVPRTLLGGLAQINHMADRIILRFEDFPEGFFEILRDLRADHPERAKVIGKCDEVDQQIETLISLAIRFRNELRESVGSIIQTDQPPQG